MSLTNIVKTSSSKPFYKYQRQFALCESCFWSATSLYNPIKEKQNSEITTSTDNLTEVCPMCNKDSVVLIPLQENEAYQMSLGDKRGLEIEFSLLKPR
ncbi:MAG TPA: hypothetical protein VJ799_02020 [Nitrososphaeraceae archaeon]|jgi:hypothetical protein|nr:hypothetical protein [Nitrososphaeraceae archaeon]